MYYTFVSALWKIIFYFELILLDPVLEESLYHEFKKYGEIINIVIKVNNNHERYAYVQFAQYVLSNSL